MWCKSSFFALKVISLVFSFQAYSFNTNQFIKLIHQKNADTVLKAIKLLPDEIRENYTLQHTTTGLQEGSYLSPRVLAFQPNAKFIATFNANKYHQGYHVLEIIEFNDTTNNFELYELNFEHGLPSKIPQRNPGKCLVCHGNPVSPIFSSYKKWPNFFGSNADILNKKEQYYIQRFNKLRQKNISWYDNLSISLSSTNFKRYSQLSTKPSLTNLYFPYRRAKGQLSEKYTHLRPNARLGMFLNRLKSLSIYNEIKKHPNYKRLLPLLVISSCPDCINSQTLHIPRQSQLRRYYKKLSDSEFKNLYQDMINYIDHNIARVQNIYSSLQIDISDIYKLLGIEKRRLLLSSLGETTKENSSFYLDGIGPEPMQGEFLLEDFYQLYPEYDLPISKISQLNLFSETLTDQYSKNLLKLLDQEMRGINIISTQSKNRAVLDDHCAKIWVFIFNLFIADLES